MRSSLICRSPMRRGRSTLRSKTSTFGTNRCTPREYCRKRAFDAMFTPVTGDYGYGWSVRKEFNRSATGHGGGINGFSTMLIRFPEDKVCAIALSNMEAPTTFQIARNLAAIAFGEKYDIP